MIFANRQGRGGLHCAVPHPLRHGARDVGAHSIVGSIWWALGSLLRSILGRSRPSCLVSEHYCASVIQVFKFGSLARSCGTAVSQRYGTPPASLAAVVYQLQEFCAARIASTFCLGCSGHRLGSGAADASIQRQGYVVKQPPPTP